jgi:hypothetical protein
MGAVIGAIDPLANANSDQIKKMLQVAASQKEPSPIERELQHLQSNIKQLYGELDNLGRQLQPVLTPNLPEKGLAQVEQTGKATAPLHHSIYGANVQITKLVQQVVQLRRALCI